MDDVPKNLPGLTRSKKLQKELRGLDLIGKINKRYLLS